MTEFNIPKDTFSDEMVNVKVHSEDPIYVYIPPTPRTNVNFYFIDNFSMISFKVDGIHYITSEHYY
jgi:predicted NAD-dependent protein-ADP-ribosyltransferase YbiA (DUF1768 family)